MELSQLQMFQTVAEEGSIIKAAQRLHCVPSNITTRIKKLEEELGTSLFIRQGRGLVISPSGLLFLKYTKQILTLCQNAKQAVSQESEPAGLLRIGAIESSATGRLPKLLSQYHQDFPSVEMQFSTATWSQLLNDVIENRLDGAIVAVDHTHPDLNSVEVYQEELVLITPSSSDDIKAPNDLIGKNIFMWPKGCPYRETLENWLTEKNTSMPITSIASYGAIFGCVSSGAGISLVPKGMFEQYNGADSVKSYQFKELTALKHYFIWNKNIERHTARNAFLEQLKTSFE